MAGRRRKVFSYHKRGFTFRQNIRTPSMASFPVHSTTKAAGARNLHMYYVTFVRTTLSVKLFSIYKR